MCVGWMNENRSEDMEQKSYLDWTEKNKGQYIATRIKIDEAWHKIEIGIAPGGIRIKADGKILDWPESIDWLHISEVKE